jgi:hypothetical protein
VSRRAKLASRVGLVVASIASLAVGALWWFAAGLTAGSHDSACQDEASAEVAWVLANVGLALAIVGFVAAIVRRLELGWSALGLYVALFAVAFALLTTCGSG